MTEGNFTDPVKCGDDHLWTCLECYVLVLEYNRMDHDQWHEHLRRSVDETGTLGLAVRQREK